MPSPAAATQQQKFKVGDRVLWKGKVYKIEMTEIFDGVFRYRFFTDEGYAMAREEDLQPAPAAAEKPKFGEFKIGDSVIYRQGTPGEATFTIKKAEIENGKFFYIMTAMRGAYPYRIAEDELILAPSTEEVKEEAKLEKEATEEIKRTQAVEAEVEEEEEEIAQESSWKKGMPLTDDQIEQAKYDAIMHVADEDIPRTVMLYYNQQGKDAALRVLKEKIMNWGQGGPDEPDLRGTPKGVEVSNAIMNPTDVRMISFPDLLDYIIRWDQAKAEAYNKPSVAPIAPPVAKPTPTVPLEKPAAVIQPPAPAPRPTKILSSEDMRLLQDYWNTQFIRAIGKIPAGYSSVFRIEFQEVKTLPFAEAKNAILAAADREIERIEQEQRARVTIRQGERIGPGQPAKKTPTQRTPMTDKELEEENEEGFRVPVGGRVPPSFFPPNALSVEQPFPRWANKS